MTSARSRILTTLAVCLICLTILGCGSTRVVTETVEVPVIQERLVPIDPELTRAQTAPDLVPRIWMDAAVIAIHYRHRWESCEARMMEIRKLGDQ